MKKIFLLIAFIFICLSFFGQKTTSYRQIIENEYVPKKVITEFQSRYPKAYVKMWFVTSITYWYEDYGPTYYNGWYKPRTVVVYSFDQAPNYEVEFMNNGEQSRAIFNRYGVWFETRTKVTALPDDVEDALLDSEYALWKWSDYKERIEAPGMPGSVYRLNVTQQHHSNILRLDEKGKIVQIKSEQ